MSRPRGSRSRIIVVISTRTCVLLRQHARAWPVLLEVAPEQVEDQKRPRARDRPAAREKRVFSQGPPPVLERRVVRRGERVERRVGIGAWSAWPASPPRPGVERAERRDVARHLARAQQASRRASAGSPAPSPDGGRRSRRTRSPPSATRAARAPARCPASARRTRPGRPSPRRTAPASQAPAPDAAARFSPSMTRSNRPGRAAANSAANWRERGLAQLRLPHGAASAFSRKTSRCP